MNGDFVSCMNAYREDCDLKNIVKSWILRENGYKINRQHKKLDKIFPKTYIFWEKMKHSKNGSKSLIRGKISQKKRILRINEFREKSDRKRSDHSAIMKTTSCTIERKNEKNQKIWCSFFYDLWHIIRLTVWKANMKLHWKDPNLFHFFEDFPCQSFSLKFEAKTFRQQTLWIWSTTIWPKR